jgi:hypothetical protein
VYEYVCGGEGQLVTEFPLESPPVGREWPIVVIPLVSLNKGPHFKTSSLVKNKNKIMGLDGARSQDQQCWRGPAAISVTDRRIEMKGFD